MLRLRAREPLNSSLGLSDTEMQDDGGRDIHGRSGIEALQRLFNLQNVVILKGHAAHLKDWLSVLTEWINQS